MSMSRDLGDWTWLLGREAPRGLRQRTFELIVCQVFPQVLVGVTALLMAAAVVVSGDLVETSTSVNMACGFYSCIGANVTFFRRRDRTVAILTDLKSVASLIETGKDRDPEVERALRRAHRMNRRMTRLQTYFGVSMVSAVWYTVLSTGRMQCPIWPPPPNDATELAVGLLQATGMLVGSTGFYAAGALIGCMVSSLVGQLDVLCLWLRNAQTERDVQRAIELHKKITILAREVERLFCDSMMHFMLCCFTAPLICTLQFLQDATTMLTFTSSVINLIVFMPLAILSQLLTNASLAVREDAFHAAFEVADGDTAWRRRSLLLVELAAAKPARLSFKGLGPLSLSSAGNALRTWYSVTSLLVNTVKHKSPAPPGLDELPG